MVMATSGGNLSNSSNSSSSSSNTISVGNDSGASKGKQVNMAVTGSGLNAGEGNAASGPTPQSVGREFVRQYYTLLNQAPLHLHRFYSSNSSFIHGGLEPGGAPGAPVVGQQEIHKRIMQLNFRDCHAKIRQVDAHSTLGEGVVVQVSGELSNNGQPMRRFMQTFVLAPQSAKKYYVHNDIFRYQDEVFDDEEQVAAPSSNGAEAVQPVVAANLNKSSGPITVSINPGPQVTNVPEQAAAILQAQQQTNVPEQAAAILQAQQQQQAQQQAQQLAAAQQAAAQQQQAQQQAARQAQQQQQQLEENGNAAKENAPVEKQPEQVKENVVRQEQAPAAVISSPPAASTLPAPHTTDLASSPMSSSSNASSANNNSAPTKKPAAAAPAPSGGPISYANMVQSSKPTGPPVVSVKEQAVAVPKENKDKQPFAGRRSGGAPQQQPSEDGNADDGAPSHPGQGQGQGHRGGRGGMGRGGSMMSRGGGIAGSASGAAGSGEGGPLAAYPDSQQVFVGNLPHDCSEAELKALFETWGCVAEIRINIKGAAQAKTTPSGVRVPNFGFIVFDSDDAVKRCLEAKPIYLNTEHRPNHHRLNVEEKKMKVPGDRGSMRRERGERGDRDFSQDHGSMRGERGQGSDRGRGGSSMRGQGSDRGRGGPKGGSSGAPSGTFPRKKSPYQMQQQQERGNNS